MIPVWVLTLGHSIFPSGSVGIPYSRIIRSGVGLFIPLAIGYVIQVYFKKLARVMVRILKPFSILLILFIIIFAIVTNFYLFKLFTWQVSFYLAYFISYYSFYLYISLYFYFILTNIFFFLTNKIFIDTGCWICTASYRLYLWLDHCLYM